MYYKQSYPFTHTFLNLKIRVYPLILAAAKKVNSLSNEEEFLLVIKFKSNEVDCFLIEADKCTDIKC